MSTVHLSIAINLLNSNISDCRHCDIDDESLLEKVLEIEDEHFKILADQKACVTADEANVQICLTEEDQQSSEQHHDRMFSCENRDQMMTDSEQFYCSELDRVTSASIVKPKHIRNSVHIDSFGDSVQNPDASAVTTATCAPDNTISLSMLHSSGQPDLPEASTSHRAGNENHVPNVTSAKFGEPPKNSDDNFVREILLVAPTGKAANLLGQRTGIMAFTLHQVIFTYLGWKKKENNREPFRFDSVEVLVVDEASLVAVTTLSFVLWILSERLKKIVILGDINQLPSIESGYF